VLSVAVHTRVPARWHSRSVGAILEPNWPLKIHWTKPFRASLRTGGQTGPANNILRSTLTFAVIAKAMKATQTGNRGDAIRALSSGVKALSDALGDSNSEYLLSIVIPEVQRLRDRFDRLEERHRQYLDTDWLTLLADADHKARVTRGREKLTRIAAILCGAALRPDQPSDETEEMMRVAMTVEDRDVSILSCIGPPPAERLYGSDGPR